MEKNLEQFDSMKNELSECQNSILKFSVIKRKKFYFKFMES